MKKFFLLGVYFAFSSVLGLYAQQNDLYLEAGMLYDSKENILLKNKVIHVRDNKILKIGNREMIPENARIIDLREYTVLPGLIDAHTHVLFDQKPRDDFAEHSIHTLTMVSEALRTLRGAKRAESYLDVGVTSIKDLGNSGLFLDVALRDAINEGTVVGPRIFASGPIMASAGGQIYGIPHDHQDLVDLEYRVIKNADDAVNAVREHVNQNVDVIKICADNLPNNTRLTREEMKSIVETAHSYGLTVTAHSIRDQSAWDAIQAGVDGIEHGFFLADSTMALMAKKDVFLVPTENSRHYMDTYYELAGSDPDDLGWIDNYMANMKKRLMKALESGVTIVAGSDNYTDIETSRGVSSRDMFQAYFEAGMKPLDILQSATYLSATHMKKENEIGVLQSGTFADIIAVKGDVEQDFLTAIKDVVFVMKNGNIYMEKLE